MNNQKLNYINAVFLIVSPVVAAVGIYWWLQSGQFNWNSITLFFVLATFCELSITAGYHRLFSHRAYDAHWLVRLFFLVFGAAALQGSALLWSVDHRDHHKYVDDNEKDPYSINKGFWWAHMIWLFYKQDEQLDGEHGIAAHDLYADKLVVWQNKYWYLIGLVAGFIAPAFIAMAWGDFWGGLLWGGIFRVVVNHHSTFLINSLSHIAGDQTYSDTHSARDNWFTAFLTFGEGFHNYHHEFPSDYRNGVRFYQFDPTKWLIHGLSWIGMTSNLRRVREETIVRKRIKMKHKRLQEKYSKQWSLPELKRPKLALSRISSRLEELGRHLNELKNKQQKLVQQQTQKLDAALKQEAEKLQEQIAELAGEFEYNVHLWKSMSRRFSKLAYQYAH